MAHIRQARTGSGLGFQVQVIITLVVPAALESEYRHLEVYLTQCIHLLVLASHPPNKIVKLLFTITNQNISLTGLWGS